jgi:PAS domain S-box-containing protein
VERESGSDEIKRLKACINDLVSVLTLPAIWSGREEPSQIGSTLLDALLGLLRLDFAYLRLDDSFSGGAPIEILQVVKRRNLTAKPEEVGRAINNWLTDDLSNLPSRVPNPMGEGMVSIALRRLGLQDQIGVLVAGSERADFPTKTERVILDVAGNQAVVGLHEARRLIEQRQIAQELDHRVTQRTRELVERDERIRRLVDANIIGVLISELEGQILESNDAFLKMVGYSREDLVSGRIRWADLTPAEWQAVSARAVAQIKATGACEVFEKEYVRKDGSRVPVLIGAAGFGGKLSVAFVVDLTERKRAEQRLRQSEAYLAEAQRLSQTGSWAWNPTTGDITYWSEECYRVLGFDPHGAPPRFEIFFQRLHPDDQAKIREQFEKAIRDKADFEFGYRIVHPDKGVRDIHVVGHAVLDRSGDLGEFIGTVIDVTERKRAEQELQQLVDFVPQFIVVFDSDGKVIRANRVAREYTGLTLEQFRSLDATDSLIHPDDLERMRAARDRGIAAGEPFEHDSRLRGKDGIYRWFLGRYNPFVEEGRVRRWYVSATEIESRKQEEERIRQENVRLEERTRIAQELHDTLLQTFQSASLHLGAAVLRVAQDSPVKNQLDRILEIMRQGIVEGRSAIQGLRSSGSQTSDLVGALSRIQDELKVQPDIDFRVTVTGRQKQLAREIQHEIYRIGREALVNAFCHSGAKRIELELEYSDSELYVRIRDNGCGIDPQMLEKGRDGHWGLAGMRERATRIGGALKILSSPAAGTEVQLSIPTSLASELSLPHHSSG